VNLDSKVLNWPACASIDLVPIGSSSMRARTQLRASCLLSSVPDLPAAILTLLRKPGQVNCMCPRCERAETLTISEFGLFGSEWDDADNWSSSSCGLLYWSVQGT